MLNITKLSVGGKHDLSPPEEGVWGCCECCSLSQSLPSPSPAVWELEMIRQLLLGRAVAVMLCRTGLLFDVPFAVYIYNGSTLITRVLETGLSREELGAHHIHHLTSMVSGAPLPGASLSTVAASVHDLEALLPTSRGTWRAEQSYSVLWTGEVLGLLS